MGSAGSAEQPAACAWVFLSQVCGVLAVQGELGDEDAELCEPQSPDL